MRLKFYVFVLFLIIYKPSFSQNEASNKADFDELIDLQTQLIPLDSIINIAIEKSPSVQFQQDLIEAAKYQVDFSKRLWTNNLVGFVNYSAGNQNLVSASSENNGSLSSTNITNGYRMGVQLNLPLYELVGRKSRINLYKSQLNSTVSKKAETIQEIKREIIQAYYSLLYYHNLITIRSDAKQTTMNQYIIAQKQFKDGLIDITELSRLKTIEVNSRADYEEVKRQFSIYYFQFEAMIGVKMNELIRSK